ncbi:MAG: methyltransferase family protein [Anaerolineae bacterium]
MTAEPAAPAAPPARRAAGRKAFTGSGSPPPREPRLFALPPPLPRVYWPQRPAARSGRSPAVTLIPVFRLGWLNAWIPVLLIWLQTPALYLLDRLVTPGLFARLGGQSGDPEETRLNYAYMALLLLLTLCAVFTPLARGSAWLYAGLAAWLAGLALLAAAVAGAAAAPAGRVFTRGAYRLSRHPAMLAQLLILAGAGLAGASWLMLLGTAGLALLSGRQMRLEERECLARFGDAYRAYMRRTRRWLGSRRA